MRFISSTRIVLNYQPPTGYYPKEQIIPWLVVDDRHEIVILPRSATQQDPGLRSYFEKQNHPDYGHITLQPRSNGESESYLYHEGGDLSIEALLDRNAFHFCAWKMVPVADAPR